MTSSLHAADIRCYEYIVIGCGGVGSAALYWLSKKAGKHVLGLEQFELGHDHGGSQDHSRVILSHSTTADEGYNINVPLTNFRRLGYHEDRYTKLTSDAYKIWNEIEEESGLKLVHVTGGIQYAKKDEMGYVIESYSNSMTANKIEFERLSGSQLHRKFHQFETDNSYVALYQKDSAIIDAVLANAVFIQLACSYGATVIERCQVLRIERTTSSNTMVHTSKGVFQCRRLVVAPGAWINQVLGSIGVHIPVYVTQEQVTYLATPNLKDFTKERFPVWCYHSPKYDFYGLPIHGNSGTKIGIDAAGPVVTSDTRTYLPDPVREKACFDHLRMSIPKAIGPKLYTKTCLYTMPPDRHFVIDTCASKGWDDVIVCCGAGHIYKFACLVGKILSQLAIDGKTEYDISGFSLDREALTVPGWKLESHMGASATGTDSSTERNLSSSHKSQL